MKVPVSYLQTDPRWANISYSAPGESTTIGKAGCGPTCMAMVIATLKDGKVTPKETAAWAISKGYKAKNQGTYYSYFTPQGRAYGVDVKQINQANVYENASAAAHKTSLDAIKNGDYVIACMGKGNWTSSGHFVLWYGLQGEKVLIHDPNSTATARTKADLPLFQNQVKYYFVVKVPQESKGEEEMDQATFNKMMDAYLKERNAKPESDWAKGVWADAVKSGMVDGFAPQGFATREQLIMILSKM